MMVFIDRTQKQNRHEIYYNGNSIDLPSNSHVSTCRQSLKISHPP
jgi:hypothetical protein